MELANVRRPLDGPFPTSTRPDAAVKQDTQFRIFRRRPENNYWDDGSPFDRATALAALSAVATATRWDDSSHAAAYGLHHAHTPGETRSINSPTRPTTGLTAYFPRMPGLSDRRIEAGAQPVLGTAETGTDCRVLTNPSASLRSLFPARPAITFTARSGRTKGVGE